MCILPALKIYFSIVKHQKKRGCTNPRKVQNLSFYEILKSLNFVQNIKFVWIELSSKELKTIWIRWWGKGYVAMQPKTGIPRNSPSIWPFFLDRNSNSHTELPNQLRAAWICDADTSNPNPKPQIEINRRENPSKIKLSLQYFHKGNDTPRDNPNTIIYIQ